MKISVVPSRIASGVVISIVARSAFEPPITLIALAGSSNTLVPCRMMTRRSSKRSPTTLAPDTWLMKLRPVTVTTDCLVSPPTKPCVAESMTMAFFSSGSATGKSTLIVLSVSIPLKSVISFL